MATGPRPYPRADGQPWLAVLRDESRPIWERMGEVAEMLPEEMVAALPKDGSRNLDHYLYGSPKRPA